MKEDAERGQSAEKAWQQVWKQTVKYGEASFSWNLLGVSTGLAAGWRHYV
jgi:hypothetical protein